MLVIQVMVLKAKWGEECSEVERVNTIQHINDENVDYITHPTDSDIRKSGRK
jgi:hypothetical protein